MCGTYGDNIFLIIHSATRRGFNPKSHPSWEEELFIVFLPTTVLHYLIVISDWSLFRRSEALLRVRTDIIIYYRVTIQVVSNLPLTPKKRLRFSVRSSY